MNRNRTEYDCKGPIEIPANCLWGAKTARAKEELFVCDISFHPTLLDSTVLVKKASALVNAELERLAAPIAKAIVQACDEVLSGQWREQFIVGPFQSGAGVVFNININEVLANRAEQILGGIAGEYRMVDPEKHVNLSQCAYDVFPTAMRIAVLLALKQFEPVMLNCERQLRREALQFSNVLKMGRTHLIDSQPITLGQEFSAFASCIEQSLQNMKEANGKLLDLNIGAGQVGTGFDTHPSYGKLMAARLRQFTSLPLRGGSDLLRLSRSMSDFLPVSAALKLFAVELNQIANDLRLLSSGPKTGLSEMNLPDTVRTPSPMGTTLLPEQSIPHLIDSVNMVCYQVMGNDLAITLAAQSGQLEANVMTPLIIHNLLQSLFLLAQVTSSLTTHCLDGISIDPIRHKEIFNKSGAFLIALSEQIGEKACQTMLEQFNGNVEELSRALVAGGLVEKSILSKILSQTYFTSVGIRAEQSQEN
jgi:aspartate ammonia-lyase